MLPLPKVVETNGHMAVHFKHPVIACSIIALCSAASAEPPISTYGTPGLIDMPVATPLEDGLLVPTLSYGGGTLKNTLSFQIAPRVTGTFRYSSITDYDGPGKTRYDRSFDINVLLMEESGVWPAISAGLRDFGGTGIYSSEYLVATKHFGDKLAVTGGLGWGRLATHGAFDNPLSVISDYFDTRGSGPSSINEVGRLEADQWFRGDAALFGGVEYRFNDRFSLRAEYSSDAYVKESGSAGFVQNTPINVALSYQAKNGANISAYALHGAELGVMATFPLHPERPKVPSGREAAPVPIMATPQRSDLGWDSSSTSTSSGETALAAAFAAEGLVLEGLTVSGDVATVRMSNQRFGALPQALGRASRLLANMMPAEVGTFRLVVTEKGMPISTTTIKRRDLVALEHDLDGSWRMFARADIADAVGTTVPASRAYPKMSFGLKPYIQPSLFDPDSPLRADLGVEATAAYTPFSGVILSGAVRQPVVGNLDSITRLSNSKIRHVRSDSGLYATQADTEIKHLTAEYFFRPGRNLYGRLTAGYLETMYGGVSGELLWYPTDSRLALGAEVNYVKQRDFDQLFGFQEYEVATGHLSAYYDFGGGYLGQIDAGRYLAKDWGATLSLDREFDNGFKIGAYFTITDIPFNDFGEGSFDKGVRLTIPVNWLTGEPSKEGVSMTIQPVTRDGGARLFVRNRLYGVTRDAHTSELEDRWGRFWR